MYTVLVHVHVIMYLIFIHVHIIMYQVFIHVHIIMYLVFIHVHSIMYLVFIHVHIITYMYKSCKLYVHVIIIQYKIYSLRCRSRKYKAPLPKHINNVCGGGIKMSVYKINKQESCKIQSIFQNLARKKTVRD